ncbi:MAG: FliH/SctL family protein [Terriglobia bacterium]
MAATAFCEAEAVHEAVPVTPWEVEPFVFETLPDAAAGAVPAFTTGGVWEPPILERRGASPNNAQPSIVRAEQAETQKKQAYELGVKEGSDRARAEFQKGLDEARSRIVSVLEEFSQQREAYFREVESEVVSLALSIARKVLHREAQVDPLFLGGAVRVSLEKIGGATRVTLRVAPAHLARWQEFIASQGHINPAPQVVADGSLRETDCLLETELGTTPLSLDTQLKEIEQGFLDLLAVRK